MTHISSCNINYIISQYEARGLFGSQGLCKERERHVMSLNKYLKVQSNETKLRQYKRQQLNAYGKWLFYAYLNASKSELVVSSVAPPETWMVF